MTLTPAQRTVLAALASGPLRTGELDTGALYALRERGYVEATIPADVVLWQLTERGKEVLKGQGEE